MLVFCFEFVIYPAYLESNFTDIKRGKDEDKKVAEKKEEKKDDEKAEKPDDKKGEKKEQDKKDVKKEAKSMLMCIASCFMFYQH